ncbi:acyltransferase domain-containing protein [Corallococcus exiguus]|uniref:type I polyketide synthase n=1 Tax=Corallococcus TaxID=83461 RepID=UPI000EC60200|nr:MULTISPECIES: type I polyketide synthase [Corallococcus]NRD65389.1 acyltransferase domain-containing protein [Corallococcus exiguus]RKI15135.1 acyltransferase domain-containing protein [Corallococcus sp. AB030]
MGAPTNSDPVTDASVLSALRSHLLEALARRNGLSPEQIDSRRPFSHYGLDSLGAVALGRALSELAGREVSPTVFWRHPSVDALLRHLSTGDADATAHVEAAGPSVARDEPIAVVGMACRLPGAADLTAFWELLRTGRDAVSEVPSGRWADGRLQQADRGGGSAPVPRRAGFLPDIAGFDPLFFGISPREAAEMDPQQRLFLELAWEALEDAGIVPRELHATATGVFVGAIWRDYAELGGAEPGRITPHTATGQALNMIANRLSYVLGLQGPSLVLDTACSSSLVAVHLACQSLWAGESTTAIVGGVSVMASPHTMVALSRFGGLSPDGVCKAFDASADGFGRGEGGGVVVLKPLSAALAAGDTIRCVIRATGSNNDGPSNGLTAPNPEAQEKLLRQVHARSGVAPGAVGYVETHGTGTALGDPIEAGALGAVFAKARGEGPPLVIGSVKTNIGHLEGAAGIAGFLKACLCVEQRTVVPSLHFTRPNPLIPFEELRLEVSRETRAWPVPDGLAVAGVSAFGWGGTNAHVVLQEAPPSRLTWVGLAASGAEALKAEARRALDALRTGVPLDALHAVLAPEASGPERLTVCVRTRGELVARLSGFLDGVAGTVTLGTAPGRPPKVAFVCAPQGGQWVGMGRRMLLTEDAFRAAFERVDAALAVHSGQSLREELFKAEGIARYDDVDVVQPLLFAFQVALAEQWRAWGITPDVVVGHSLGEIAAAHIAGILDLEEAALVIHHYSRLQKLLADRGGMAVVNLPPDALTGLLEATGGAVVLAGHNGPRSTVLSGDPAALDALLAELKRRKELCARIRVNVAAHSPQIDEILPELETVLAGLRPKPARLPMISTALRRRMEGPEVDGRYFGQNLRTPVWLAPVLASLVADGVDALVELSPHPVLVGALQQAAEGRQPPPVVLPSTTRDEDERLALYEARATLFRLGCAGAAAPVARDSLVPLSAHTPQALRELAARVAGTLRHAPWTQVEDVAATAALRRTHHAERLAVVARGGEDLAQALDAFARGEPHERLVTPALAKAPSVVFVFPGQGSQWHGMARQLLRDEPAFRAELGRCDAAIHALTGWSVLEELEASEAASRMARVDVVQPVLFAVEVALAALWRSWGVRPKAVIGHSMGEVAAAYVAGALNLADAARIICRRSQLLRRVSGQGAMLAAELTLDEAREVLRGHEAQVAVAVSNSSRSTVLSGQPQALEVISQALQARGVFWRWVKVDVASHSPQMDALKGELLEVLAGVQPSPSAVPIHSTVLDAVTDGRDFDAGYWVRNLRDPVLFASAVRRAREAGHDVFIEMSPHPILLPAVEQELADVDQPGEVLPSLRRNESERETLLRSVAALYTRGLEPVWSAVTRAGRPGVPLPSYPWQRERFWLDAAPAVRAPVAASRPSGEGLLGSHFPSALEPRLHHWQAEWGADVSGFLADHRVGGDAVVPGAVFLSMALGAAKEALGTAPVALRDIAFPQPLILGSEPAPRVQTVLSVRDAQRELQVFSQGEGRTWVPHARALVDAGPAAAVGRERAQEALALRDSLRGSAAMLLDSVRYYELLAGCGLEYRAAFRGVDCVWSREAQALGRILPPAASVDPELARVACIDSALQLSIATLPPSLVFRGRQLISVGVDGFALHRLPEGAFHVHAQRRPGGEGPVFLVDVVAFTDAGEPLFHVDGLKVRVLDVARPAVARNDEAQPAAAPPRTLFDELGALEPSRRRSRAEDELRQVVATVLKLAPARVPVDQPLRTLGMDSVMSLELRNRIEARTGIRLSATALWNHPTVEALTGFVLSQASSAPAARSTPARVVPPAPVPAAPAVPADAALPSDLELERLLEAELVQVHQLIKES